MYPELSFDVSMFHNIPNYTVLKHAYNIPEVLIQVKEVSLNQILFPLPDTSRDPSGYYCYNETPFTKATCGKKRSE